VTIVKMNTRQFYTQVTNSKVANISKLKENYSNLLTKKIENIHRIINDTGKFKPHIKMTTKGSLQKQIIVSMGKNNIIKFIALSSIHIANLNRSLKNTKLNVIADYI